MSNFGSISYHQLYTLTTYFESVIQHAEMTSSSRRSSVPLRKLTSFRANILMLVFVGTKYLQFHRGTGLYISPIVNAFPNVESYLIDHSKSPSSKFPKEVKLVQMARCHIIPHKRKESKTKLWPSSRQNLLLYLYPEPEEGERIRTETKLGYLAFRRGWPVENQAHGPHRRWSVNPFFGKPLEPLAR